MVQKQHDKEQELPLVEARAPSSFRHIHKAEQAGEGDQAARWELDSRS